MFYRLARNGFFQLDAEQAHDLAIENFKRFTGTPVDLLYRQQLPHRTVNCMGLTFRNPVGLAAGLDKNGECIEAFERQLLQSRYSSYARFTWCYT